LGEVSDPGVREVERLKNSGKSMHKGKKIKKENRCKKKGHPRGKGR